MVFSKRGDAAQNFSSNSAEPIGLNSGISNAPRQAFPPAMPAPVSASEPIMESVIGNDLSIEGQTITIRCKGSLKVLGNIQADLHSRRLEVGKEAIINGAIAADTINVFGRVQGSILGAKVILHAGADVEGDIMSQLLSVEEGANFDGRSKRVTNPADIAPQLERTGQFDQAAAANRQPVSMSRSYPQQGPVLAAIPG